MFAVWVVVMLLLLFLVEGAASFAYMSWSLLFRPPLPSADRFHTRFDSELGWVNIPNYYIKDMYGPGAYLRTNSQGFRNNEDFTKEIPANKFRIICSGDSFTLGYGVSNDDSWCDALTRIESRFQTVNLGQGGYGIDQSYLLFLRDGTKLDADLHILAFIDDDFQRMTAGIRYGYGKPFLELEGDKLVVRNVPVPKSNTLLIRLGRRLPALNSLRTLQIAQQLGRQFSGSAGTQDNSFRKVKRVLPVAMKVFETWQEISARIGSHFVLVYLPRETDCIGNPAADELRQFLQTELEKRGMQFWDLTYDFQKLPAKELKKMFIGPGQLPYARSAGHYTPAGNQLVAELLHRRIVAMPEILQELKKTNTAVQAGDKQSAR
jgi:hypothetical protein